jgi:hypothetical protein
MSPVGPEKLGKSHGIKFEFRGPKMGLTNTFLQLPMSTVAVRTFKPWPIQGFALKMDHILGHLPFIFLVGTHGVKLKLLLW